MRLIQEAADQELVWRQLHAIKHDYALCAGDEVLATLQWDKPLGTSAIACTADEAWTFERSGFWKPHVGVRPVGSDDEVATFSPAWNGNGTLAIAGGRTFHWSGKDFWGLQKVWQERDDTPPLLGYKRLWSLKTEAQLVLSPVAAALPETTQLDDLYQPLAPDEMGPLSEMLAELPLLASLGFYLIVLETMDAAATG